MKKESHITRCLEYIQKNGSITSKQAFEELGNSRLAATINTLRNKGYDIVTTTISVPSRFKDSKGQATTTKVAMYTLSTFNQKTFGQKLKDKVSNIFKSK